MRMFTARLMVGVWSQTLASFAQNRDSPDSYPLAFVFCGFRDLLGVSRTHVGLLCIISFGRLITIRPSTGWHPKQSEKRQRLQ